MTKKGAESFYYFDERFFNEVLFTNCRKYQGNIFGVVRKGELYSAAIFLKSGPYVTYFLSARNLAHRDFPTMNFLLSKSIQSFCEDPQDSKLLNLGGGVSVFPDDSLLKFKKVFGGDLKSFFIGKRIFNNDLYSEIQKIWLGQFGPKEEQRVKTILQFYHQHVPRGYIG